MAPMQRDRVSRTVSGMALSAIKDMALRAAAVPGAVSLTWGLPSFATPAPVREAVTAALADDADAGKYTLPTGLTELRALAAADFERRGGRNLDPDHEILVTAGNMEGVKVLLRTLLDPGDEVIVTDPGFASHLGQIALCGGKPVFLRLDAERGWGLDAAALEALITPRTKALILISPHNPTGAVFGPDALDELMRIAERRNLPVLLDDPYSHYVYDDARTEGDPLVTVGRYPNLVYMFTFSKAFAMSGWRIGYIALPPDLAAQALKVHDATMICAPRVSQLAAIAALDRAGSAPGEFRQVLDGRRRLICERLDRVPELFDYVRPEGAYYVFPRIAANETDSVAFSMRLLHEAGVVVTPGVAFGPTGEGHVRMAYCVEEDVINSAFDRLEAFGAGRYSA
jgi:aspartate/methionine/tyrosine aminotransferase